MHIQDQKKFINIYKLYRNEGGKITTEKCG